MYLIKKFLQEKFTMRKRLLAKLILANCLFRCSTKTDQLDEHEDSSGFYGQCPSQTESKCLTEEQGITSEEYEIRNTVGK